MATRASHHPHGHKIKFCNYRQLCLEFLLSLNWPREYFDSRYNRCFCSFCYPVYEANAHLEADELYTVPRDWMRFGLRVDSVKAKNENIWRAWIVTYHGTSVSAAVSILRHGQLLIPGDTCDDGTQLRVRPGHISGKTQIYTTQSIKYAALDVYSNYKSFQAKDGTNYNAQIIFQCRQQKGTFIKQSETVGKGRERICDIIPNESIEILTEVRTAVIPVGLLIRLTKRT